MCSCSICTAARRSPSSRVALSARRHRYRPRTNGAELPPGTALQDPSRLLGGARPRHPRSAWRRPGADADEVVGIGIDVTACTVLPVTADGTPLCDARTVARPPSRLDEAVEAPFRAAGRRPAERESPSSARSPFSTATAGGSLRSGTSRSSSRLWLEDRDVFDAMRRLRRGDRLDRLAAHAGARSAASCTAGYKACWSAQRGPPVARVLRRLPFRDCPTPPTSSGRASSRRGIAPARCGPELAARARPQPGNRRRGRQRRLVRLVARRGVDGRGVLRHGHRHLDLRPGRRPATRSRCRAITGVVEDGILAGYFGYEAGQPAVGDMFAWFVDRLIAPGESPERRQRRYDEHRGGGGEGPARRQRARRPRLVERQPHDPRRRRPVRRHRRA